jgi:hypothetical protein
LIEEGVAIFEAKMNQTAFKECQDTWLLYFRFLQEVGREEDAQRVIQRALTFCSGKEKLIQASAK